MKNYAAGVTKNRSRQDLRNFIVQNLLTGKSPANINVVHFPGPQSMEFKEVYGPLGIPPSNITGVEKVKPFADQAANATPSMKVFSGKLSSWIAENPAIKEDIISLDYDGTFSEGVIKDLEAINRKAASDSYVLHVAVRKGREQHKVQGLLKLPLAVAFENKEKIIDSLLGEDILLFKSLMRSYEEGDLEAIRCKGFTINILNAIKGQGLSDGWPKLFGRAPKVSEEAVSLAENLQKTHSLKYSYSLKFACAILEASEALDKGCAKEISHLQRYEYIGDHLAPMIGDMYMVKNKGAILKAYEELFSLVKKASGSYHISDIKSFKAKLEHVCYLSQKNGMQLFAQLFDRRIHHGSSAQELIDPCAAKLWLKTRGTQYTVSNFRISETKLSSAVVETTQGRPKELLSKEDVHYFILGGMSVSELLEYCSNPAEELFSWERGLKNNK